MGRSICGVCGKVCCWRCDNCPKCDGFRLQRGDYCPSCTAKFKAEGYQFSTFYMDWMKPEEFQKRALEAIEIQKANAEPDPVADICQGRTIWNSDGTDGPALICPPPAPRQEQTPAGMQTIIEETPARSIPDAPLRPKKKQSEKPLALENVEAKQGRLF